MKPIHLAYTVAQRVRVLWRRAIGVRTRGVKAVVLKGDAVLLIRHSYQSSHLYMLPGGGVKRGETPIAAAIREVREETGCRLTGAREHGDFLTRAEGWSDHVTVVIGSTVDEPVADGREVIEARLFPMHALPPNVSDASLRRIAEIRDGRPPSGEW
ncbi:ADP-ribose pyrophosphatase YjhB (NUDIX family) [Blastomonas natatoria]|uniref:ADP-ribose pyrophosphatase YjhB (NUDIX family) n=1 Tax=Blastomonas natatoria TaxID=34015 RepID=A0A2V3V0J5_9SPHN|nr:NUDIX domain-containing protein [Blastomonas natatoria]PXW75253.1 ADP-ribose pyrophosphatase YjhB (NUDIX family) [Blastomonas natatoria]